MLHNLRFAWRTLCTKPVFAFVAVLSLALGIGANTAIFSVIESSLLRGLPYKDPGQLVTVNINLPQKSGLPVSPGDFVDYGRQSKALVGLAAFTQEPLTLTGVSQTISLQAAIVSPNLFDVLGVTAERGRLISSKLDVPNTGTRVAVLSDATWRATFGADESIIGQDVTLNGKLYRVVGVLSPKQAQPAGFQLWVNGGSWIPHPGDGGDLKHLAEAYDVYWLHGIARVKSGFTLSQAQAEANVIFKQINAAHPKAKNDVCVLHPMQDTMVAHLRPALWILFTAVVVLLCIACANLAGLLLARATGRTREVAVRLALGATRTEILRLMLTESLLLAIAGGACGLFVAAAGVKLIAHYLPYQLPAMLAPELNLPVLCFCLAATIFSALLSGLLPALHSSHLDIATGLNEGAKGTASKGAHRTRSILVGAEIALSVMLLIGASLLLHSFAKLISVSPGFNPNGAVTARLYLPQSRYKTPVQIASFWNQLLPQLSAVPGVQSAGLLTDFPFDGLGSIGLIQVEGQHLASPRDGTQIFDFGVGPQTFQTLQTPLLAGRGITDKDTAGSPRVAVVSKHFADLLFPHQNPIGKRYERAGISGWITVVGVVGNVTFSSLGETPEVAAYYSYQQMDPRSSGIVLRGDPSIQDLRHVVRNVDPAIPLTDVKPLGDYLSQSLASRRFLLGLLTAFSALAVLLAATGLYAVLAYSVQQRKQEIGIRVALGATGRNVLWLILRESLSIAVLGTAAGLVGAIWTTSFLKSMLYGVTTTDLTAYVAAVILILIIALASALGPALRAARIDPLSALRYE